MLVKSITRLSIPWSQSIKVSRFASIDKGEIKPKKFERTPVGRLEDDDALKRKNEEEGDVAPRRRIVNPETGEIGGPQVSAYFCLIIS
jgi:hypothetical protein